MSKASIGILPKHAFFSPRVLCYLAKLDGPNPRGEIERARRLLGTLYHRAHAHQHQSLRVRTQRVLCRVAVVDHRP